MKISKPPTDGKLHIYCIRCRKETVRERAPSAYICVSCGFASRRALIIDPAVSWWLDDNGEYWHESAGVFVRNREGKFLFLERAKYPSGLTIPIGHVDRGEAPVVAGQRELFEEAGVKLPLRALKLIIFDSFLGDKCRRGSDAHRWNVYSATLRHNVTVKVNRSEALRAEWLTLQEALRSDLVPILRLVIERHSRAILGGAR